MNLKRLESGVLGVPPEELDEDSDAEEAVDGLAARSGGEIVALSGRTQEWKTPICSRSGPPSVRGATARPRCSS